MSKRGVRSTAGDASLTQRLRSTFSLNVKMMDRIVKILAVVILCFQSIFAFLMPRGHMVPFLSNSLLL